MSASDHLWDEKTHHPALLNRRKIHSPSIEQARPVWQRSFDSRQAVDAFVRDWDVEVTARGCSRGAVNHLRALGAKETDEDTRIFDENDPLGQRRIRSITVSERTWTWVGRY